MRFSEFFEKVLGYSLPEWQKDILEKIYTVSEKNKKLMPVYRRDGVIVITTEDKIDTHHNVDAEV